MIQMSLNELSDEVRISCQTLVSWADRHLIDAELGWELDDDNAEVRVIRINETTRGFLRSFASEYRDDTVSRPEARRLLKKIDPRNVKRLIRSGDVQTVRLEDELRIVIGSIEDYLMERERDVAVA